MDEVIERIKEYVLVLEPEIEQDELLDFVVQEVVDRVLVYTNRGQLIADFEEDDELYAHPVPNTLERPIARIVKQVFKTNSADGGREVTSIKDGQQSITFGDRVEHYLSSSMDAELFVSIKPMLDKFRIPTIVETT